MTTSVPIDQSSAAFLDLAPMTAPENSEAPLEFKVGPSLNQ